MSPQRHTRFNPLGRTLAAGTAAGLPSWLLCLALLLLGTSPHSAHAARRVALLIGNGQYQHETVLPNPVRDVALLERTLTQIGFTVDKLENLDKRGMELAINRFASKTAGADTALVFYAGHGTQPSKGGRSFLLPVNAQVSDDETLETDGVPADDIASKLERTSNPAKLRLVILDACRSRKTSRGTDRGLAPPKSTDDYTLIAYSTNDGETADDGKGANSPYAQALAKLLPRLKTEPVRVVFEETAREVRAATGHKQKPRTYGDLESRVGLDGVLLASVTPVPTGLPVVAAQQADPEQEVWQAAKAANTVAAYEAYLAEYPRGKFASAARIGKTGLTATATPPVFQPVIQPTVQTDKPTATVIAPHASAVTSQPPVRLVASTHTLVVPDIAENGAVVPVGVDFSPPLNAGDVAELLMDGQSTATIRVEQGSLSQFQTRLRFPRSDLVRLRVNGQDLSASKHVMVTLAGEVATTASFAGDPMRIRAQVGQVRVLASAKSVNGGTVKMEADGLRG